MNRTIGYWRVSTKGQNEDRQVDAFKELGIDERDILGDKESGKSMNRKAYKALTEQILREGDTLVIYSIDRLGRNYKEIKEEWERITKELKCNIKVIDMPLLDTSVDKDNLDKNFISDLVLQILSYVAQKELESNKARQAAGYKAMNENCEKIDCVSSDKQKCISRKTGKAVGRPSAQFPANWESVYKSWKTGQIKAVEAMRQLELTKNTFYNLVKRYEKESLA